MGDLKNNLHESLYFSFVLIFCQLLDNFGLDAIDKIE